MATRRTPSGNGTPTRKRSTARRPEDAISVLKADHRRVEDLFTRFEAAGPRALKTKRSLVDRMIAELSVHAAIEEAVLYPAARSEVPETESEVLEALEEHHVVKWELSELEGMAPDDERFGAKITVMTENVRHHVKEEESTLFPALRRHLTRSRLIELGEELERRRALAPTRPHPRGPDSPPQALAVDAVAGALDKARDLVRSARS
jgi:hemerythrin-like domain-containing protein